MKWIITNRNHGGYGRSQGKENVGKLLSLSVSQISVGPPWGYKETSSCLGKGNSHHSPSYANRFNVSTSYPCGYFSTLVCLVQKCVSSSHTFLCVRCLIYGLISVRPRKKKTPSTTHKIYIHMMLAVEYPVWCLSKLNYLLDIFEDNNNKKLASIFHLFLLSNG